MSETSETNPSFDDICLEVLGHLFLRGGLLGGVLDDTYLILFDG